MAVKKWKEGCWINILFAERDPDFRERLSRYMVEKLRDISLTICDDKFDTAESPENFQLIVADESLKSELSSFLGEKDTDIRIIYLVSDERNIEADKQLIYRYQSAGEILSEIVAEIGIIKNGSNTKISHSRYAADKRACKTVYVCGFSGGCGKTAVSMVLAKSASVFYGQKVLVISTGRIPDVNEYFCSDTEQEADMGILLLNLNKRKCLEPGRYLLTDDTGISCIKACEDDFLCLDNLSTDEFISFIEYITEWDIFDLIIIDVKDISRMALGEIFKEEDSIVTVKDARRLSYKSENMQFRNVFSGYEPVIVENFVMPVKKDGIFISEAELDAETDENLKFIYEPESFSVESGQIQIDISGELGKCGALLYRKLFLEGSGC